MGKKGELEEEGERGRERERGKETAHSIHDWILIRIASHQSRMQVLQSPRLFTMSYMCSIEKHIKGPIYCDWILSYNRITFLTALSQQIFGIVSAKRDLTHVFFKVSIFILEI